MVFQDYGRYANLMAESSARERKVRNPAHVSFVGQTSAGKSTLIWLLVELNSSATKLLHVPVAGSIKQQDTPTSGDVHLYGDPLTSEGRNPVLYADCEGLEGGTREPMGPKSRNKIRRKETGEEHRQRYNISRKPPTRWNHRTSE